MIGLPSGRILGQFSPRVALGLNLLLGIELDNLGREVLNFHVYQVLMIEAQHFWFVVCE